MRIFKLTAILAGLVVFGGHTTGASAGSFTYQSYGFSGENVHITDVSLDVNNEYGGAGLITLNGSSTITAYCVDIADWLLGSGTYNTGVNPTSNPNLAGLSTFTGHSKIADIGALIANGSNDAAVQVAIWETEYGAAVTITPEIRTCRRWPTPISPTCRPYGPFPKSEPHGVDPGRRSDEPNTGLHGRRRLNRRRWQYWVRR